MTEDEKFKEAERIESAIKIVYDLGSKNIRKAKNLENKGFRIGMINYETRHRYLRGCFMKIHVSL